jgi:ATP-dependent helicase/nuclease subunit A
MEMARDEVRVMTVHGAKGLEANTVILADTTTEPKGAHPPKLLTLEDGALTWATRMQDDTAAMSQARQAANIDARDEYRRLLYVAMTRAAERLVICGSKGKNKIPDGCWYQLVDDALRDDCVAEPADDGDGEVLRYRKGPPQPEPAKPAETVAPKVVSLPPWLITNVAPERTAVRTITPSNAEDDDTRPAATGGGNLALLRGSLVHRLMQSLPDIPPERRAKAAADYLSRSGEKLPGEDRAKIIEQVMRVLEDVRFQALFAPGSRAEVPIVGKLTLGGITVRVSGQIDRLAVTETSVVIGDFKTNRPAPRRIEDVPPAYLRQLALYRAVLVKLYPDREVRAALVWTEVPDLMEVSAEVLDRTLARVT